MNKSIAVWILSALFPLSVGAGELVIRETETAIIVEFNGDADDKQTEKNLQEAQLVDQTKPSQPSSPAAVKGKNAPQSVAATSAQQIIDRNTGMIRRAEIRRKTRESKRSLQDAQGAPEDD